MVYDTGSTALPWPTFVIVLSAGSLFSTVLLLIMCSCCFKTKVPQYKAKVVKNVVAKEDMRRSTPRKIRFQTHRPYGDSLILNGTTIGSPIWSDYFIEGRRNVPSRFTGKTTPPNPPDVIMHPALIGALKRESRKDVIINVVPPTVSPERDSSKHPSTSLGELMRQEEDAEPSTPLSEYPLNRNGSQEFNRDGSILYYKPRREAGKSVRRSSHIEPLKQEPQARSRTNDMITSRIEDLRKSRKQTAKAIGDSPGLPHFDRASGEWDNVPKPRHIPDTPPPIPSRNYSIDDSDIGTDCSEVMPRPAKDRFINDKRINNNNPLSNHNRVSYHKSSEISRQSSRSSAASRKNFPRSPENMLSPQFQIRNPRNSSPISDTVFVPNGNPAYVHGSDTPPGHPPKRLLSVQEPVNARPINSDFRSGVLSDGPPAGDRHVRRHKRVNDLIEGSHDHQHPKQGAFLRPKPRYPNERRSEKRFSDGSNSANFDHQTRNYQQEQNNYDPYFFRSRWSAAIDPQDDFRLGRRSPDLIIEDERPMIRQTENRRSAKEANRAKAEKRIQSQRHPHPVSSNESSPELPGRNRSSKSPTKSRRISQRANKQVTPLPETPFSYAFQQNQRRDSPSKRSREQYRSPQAQPPLEVLVEQQHGSDGLVSPGHRPNYTADVAKIRRGLRQSYSENRSQRQPVPPVPERISNRTESNQSLAESNNYALSLRRQSSDYGSLIDIIVHYRNNVRKAREKEKPTESPQSRLLYEREKLKSKLKDELRPQNMQSKNVDMVIETLIYLCEAESSRNKKKRSWQRENQNETKGRRSRSNSLVTTPTDEKDFIPYNDYYEKHVTENARIRSQSDTQNKQNNVNAAYDEYGNKNVEKRSESEIIAKHKPRNGFLSQQSMPDYNDKDFSFPTVDELDRIIGEFTTPPASPGSVPPPISLESTPPPVPPRRDLIPQNDRKAPPPPISPRIHESNVRNLPTSSKESPIKIPNGLYRGSPDTTMYSRISTGQTTDEEILEISLRKNIVGEPDYAKLRKKSDRERRRSLPSMHLTESELQWLQQSGGAKEDVSKRRNESKFQPGHRNNGNMFVSERGRNRAKQFLGNQGLPAPPEPPREQIDTAKATFTFDDIRVDETTDAEDIIKAVEMKMSQGQPSVFVNPSRQLQKNSIPPNPQQSDVSTFSSATSGEIPITRSPRPRLVRYEGGSPKHNETPSGSPVFLRNGFHTPPPNEKSANKLDLIKSRERKKVELSRQVNNIKIFRTPPSSPHPVASKGLASARKFTSTGNISLTPPTTPISAPHSRMSHLSPRKQSVPVMRPISPMPTDSKNSSESKFSQKLLSRRRSKFAPNIPFMSKRLIEPRNPDEIVVPIESTRRKISRKGEVIYLPADDEYADPLDVINPGSDRYMQPFRSPQAFSPLSPRLNTDSNTFIPIIEDDYDYAVPFNQRPSYSLKQRILARSMENIASECESSV